jgi:CRP-like cAMP-binding protein
MALDDDIGRLTRIPLFAELERDALRLVAFSAETRILRQGDVIFRKGDSANAGYFVLSGSIAIAADGGSERLVGPDCLIGERALMIPLKRSATATAREACSILQISRATFHRVLNEFPDSAVRVRAFVAARLVGFSRDLASSSLASHGAGAR